MLFILYICIDLLIIILIHEVVSSRVISCKCRYFVGFDSKILISRRVINDDWGMRKVGAPWIKELDFLNVHKNMVGFGITRNVFF